LKRYASENDYRKEFEQLMEDLSYVNSGGKFTRDEMNER
jgi:hypothetical protein